MAQATSPRSGSKTLLTVFIVVLVVVIAVYSALWLVLKNKTENALAKLQPQVPVEFSYAVGGYPFHLKVTLRDLVIPQTSEDAAMLQAFGFTPAKTDGIQMRAVGDTVLSMAIFGKSAVVTLPQEFTEESGKQPIRYQYAKPAKIELGYSTPNLTILSDILTGAPAPEPKELVSRFRSLSYKDHGVKMSTADGTMLAEWSEYDMLVAGKPVAGDMAEVTLHLTVEDMNFGTQGYYKTYLNNLGDYQGPSLLFRDFAGYILDYPYYALPVSMDFDANAKFPMNADKDQPFTGEFNLTRLSVRDGNGEGLHTGKLTIAKSADVVEAYGDYALKVDNFPSVLSRYVGMVANVMKMADARRSEITALSGKPVNVPPAAQIDAVAPTFETQLKAFLTAIGALDGDKLFLTVEKKQGGEMTVNGKTQAEIMPLFQQNAMPVIQQLGAMQQQPQ